MARQRPANVRASHDPPRAHRAARELARQVPLEPCKRLLRASLEAKHALRALSTNERGDLLTQYAERASYEVTNDWIEAVFCARQVWDAKIALPLDDCLLPIQSVHEVFGRHIYGTWLSYVGRTFGPTLVASDLRSLLEGFAANLKGLIDPVQEGLEIALRCRIKRNGHGYVVPSPI